MTCAAANGEGDKGRHCVSSTRRMTLTGVAATLLLSAGLVSALGLPAEAEPLPVSYTSSSQALGGDRVSVLERATRTAERVAEAERLRTGLPVSEIPYAFNDPAGLQGAAELATAGEPTVGHPLYRFVFTNTYDFGEGC